MFLLGWQRADLIKKHWMENSAPYLRDMKRKLAICLKLWAEKGLSAKLRTPSLCHIWVWSPKHTVHMVGLKPLQDQGKSYSMWPWQTQPWHPHASALREPKRSHQKPQLQMTSPQEESEHQERGFKVCPYCMSIFLSSFIHTAKAWKHPTVIKWVNVKPTVVYPHSRKRNKSLLHAPGVGPKDITLTKANHKRFILCHSIYITFFKYQNYRDQEQMNGFQDIGEGCGCNYKGVSWWWWNRSGFWW